jgi:hypothetical protein
LSDINIDQTIFETVYMFREDTGELPACLQVNEAHQEELRTPYSFGERLIPIEYIKNLGTGIALCIPPKVHQAVTYQNKP